MTFSQAVKQEVLNNALTLAPWSAGQKAFLAGIVAIQNQTTPNFLIHCTDAELSHNLFTFLTQVIGTKPEETLWRGRHAFCYDPFPVNFTDLIRPSGAKQWKRSFLAGAFLAGGSMHSPLAGDYHLELRVKQEGEARRINAMLKDFGLTARFGKYQRGFLIYVKKSLLIADFLNIIGAHQRMLQFENYRIERDYLLSSVRVGNCEIANFKKAMQAGEMQIALFNTLKQGELTPVERELIKLRQQNPDATNLEIAALMQAQTGQMWNKSMVGYRFKCLVNRARQGRE